MNMIIVLVDFGHGTVLFRLTNLNGYYPGDIIVHSLNLTVIEMI